MRAVGRAAGAFHKVQRLLILPVARIHLHGGLIVPLRLVQPTPAVAYSALKKVPLRVVVGVIRQQRLCPAQIAGVDGHTRLLQNGTSGLLRSPSAAVTVPIAAAVSAVACGAAASAAPTAAPQLVDLLVSGVDLLHFLLRQIRQRIIVIVVGMVLPRQLQICFFHFRVRRGFGNAEYLIGIVHDIADAVEMEDGGQPQHRHKEQHAFEKVCHPRGLDKVQQLVQDDGHEMLPRQEKPPFTHR